MVLKEDKLNFDENQTLLFEGGSDPDSGDDKHCFPYYDFIRSLYRRFDGSFVTILLFENFNFGLWIMVSLCQQDYFKAYLDQEPGDMAIYSSIIVLPWSLKILWGLITDNIPICGLKRKPYLIFFAWLQFAAMLTLFLLESDDPVVVVLLLFAASFSMAFSNVVVDAILVIQSRKDSELGS